MAVLPQNLPKKNLVTILPHRKIARRKQSGTNPVRILRAEFQTKARRKLQNPSNNLAIYFASAYAQKISRNGRFFLIRIGAMKFRS